jgi:aminoglycoside phosphotransferase (APT) family kinase protein
MSNSSDSRRGRGREDNPQGQGRAAETPPDVIDVRPDETFDEARLAEFLKGKLEGSDLPLTVRQFAGGHANLTYLLQYGEGDALFEYVLRRPPLGPVAKSSHDMSREFRALSKLWRFFEPAPRAFLFSDDHSLIGADFFVMERRHGIVVRREIPPELGSGRDPGINRKLSEVLIDTLVDFHSVDPVASELDALGKAEGFLERQVRGWSDRLERSKTQELPVAEEVQRWLSDNQPMSLRATLLHNDWRLDNLAVVESDPGRCAAVFDWDMCTVGDPLCDLGTLMCSWIDRSEGSAGRIAPMPSQVEGFMRRDDGMARYGERTGWDMGQMPYYLVFGTFKMAVVLQQIYHRYAQGQTQDERFGMMEAGAAGLFERAAQLRP